ncbi:MAG: 3,4-dihydroxy-2-butanone-4-phosphate synthase [Phycisphaerales bacterium]
MPFSPVAEVIEELRRGRMVVLTDDESRENEGDLVVAAEFVTPEAVTFMLSKALGYMCLSLTEADCDRLRLHPQAAVNSTSRGTAFTVSIDLHQKHGGTTGVSARERARCIQMAIDPAYGPDDFARPGHINPLRSRDGGVLVRTGQTEGSVDLCRLAGLYPAACIIEIMKPDGEMARVPDLELFCAEHGLKMCSVAQVIEYRLERESLIRRIEPAGGHRLVTEHGAFNAMLFESMVDPLPHVALTLGDEGGIFTGDQEDGILVRMHRRNLLGDVFGELMPGGETSGGVLRDAMRAIQREGRGAIVYLRTNDRSAAEFGLEGRIQQMRQGTRDFDAPDYTGSPVPTDLRQYGVGGQILRSLGVRRMRVLTNNPRPLPGLTAFGLEIAGHVSVPGLESADRGGA